MLVALVEQATRCSVGSTNDQLQSWGLLKIGIPSVWETHGAIRPSQDYTSGCSDCPGLPWLLFLSIDCAETIKQKPPNVRPEIEPPTPASPNNSINLRWVDQRKDMQPYNMVLPLLTTDHKVYRASRSSGLRMHRQMLSELLLTCL